MSDKLQQIYKQLTDADNRSIAEWEARINNFMRGPVGIEESLGFTQQRISILGASYVELLKHLDTLEARVADLQETVERLRRANPLPRSIL